MNIRELVKTHVVAETRKQLTNFNERLKGLERRLKRLEEQHKEK